MSEIVSVGKNVRISGGGNAVVMVSKGDGGPEVIAYCTTVRDNMPTPVVRETTIQGIGDKRPAEIIPPMGTMTGGSIVMAIYEFFTEHAWRVLDPESPLSQVASEDRQEKGFWDHQYQSGMKFTISRLVAKGGMGSGNAGILKTYHNCVIIGIQEGDIDTANNAQSSSSQITFGYTHYTEKVVDNNA